MTDQTPLDYSSAGVDTEAGDLAVELMKEAVSRTHDSTVIGGQAGSFAGMVDATALKSMEKPLLATSTDGVGTKIEIAKAMGRVDSIGQDLVAMVVDDLVVVGAKPLFMSDYIACGHVDPARIAAIVKGVADACAAIGCPLVSGETAEHPGVMDPEDFDIAGAATGVVDEPRMLGPHRVLAGDVVLGMASSGLHSNGYSLVRKVIEVAGASLADDVPEFGRTLGEEVLEPTRLYTKVCLDAIDVVGEGADGLHALCHVTGGGLAVNLSRVLPPAMVAGVDRGAWAVPPVFDWVRRNGNVSWEALEDSLNLGVGMIAVCAASAVGAIQRVCDAAGIETFVLGSVSSIDEGAAAAAPATAPASPDAETAADVLGLDDAVAEGLGERLVSGTKGIKGGSVRMTGDYRLA